MFLKEQYRHGKRSTYAAVKDALIKLKKEECVLGMVRRSTSTYAAAKDVQIKPYKEECVLDTCLIHTPPFLHTILMICPYFSVLHNNHKT